MRKVAIHSAPRSGSSWLGQIFNSCPSVNYKFQPLFSYAFKGYLDQNSSRDDIETFFNLIASSDDEFLMQTDMVERGLYPAFEKNEVCTHIVYKEVRYHHILENMMDICDDIIVVGLVRNPFAVINSFLRSPREFKKELGWIAMDEWRYAECKNMGKAEEYYGYEKWKELAVLFDNLRDKHPDRFYLLKYDSLLLDTRSTVNDLFDFCQIKLTDQVDRFLLESRNTENQDTYSVFKNKKKDDEWIKYLDRRIVNDIKSDLRNTLLETYIENDQPV